MFRVRDHPAAEAITRGDLMQKSDVIGWAAILGGIALAGYFGIKAFQGLFLGTGFLGSGRDIFGNPTVESQYGPFEEAVKQSAEVTESILRTREIMGERGMLSAYPGYDAALAAYEKEHAEYEAAIAAVHADWLGRPVGYEQAQKEYQEALAAYKKVVNYDWNAEYNAQFA